MPRYYRGGVEVERRSAEYHLLDFDALVATSEGAYRLRIGPRSVWIPKSVCRDMDEEAKTVEVQEWLLVDRGLV